MDIFSLSTPLLAAARHSSAPSISLIAIAAALIFVTELACFYIPGVSLSSLVIAICGIRFGFVTTLVITFPTVVAAHFILRKDITMFPADLVTVVPMIAFASEFGAAFAKSFGWGFYGVVFGFIKWGMAIAVGLLFGRDMAKRIREFFLEPLGNYFIFTYLLFLFKFLM